MVPGSGGPRRSPSTGARGSVSRTRSRGCVCPLAARSNDVLVLCAAHVLHDAGAHFLHEFPLWIFAGASSRRGVRSSRPRLLLYLELLRLGYLGGSRLALVLLPGSKRAPHHRHQSSTGISRAALAD